MLEFGNKRGLLWGAFCFFRMHKRIPLSQSGWLAMHSKFQFENGKITAWGEVKEFGKNRTEILKMVIGTGGGVLPPMER